MSINYMVVRHGVYMQGVYGLRETIEQAVECAEDSARREPDGYHSFWVLERGDGDCERDKGIFTEPVICFMLSDHEDPKSWRDDVHGRQWFERKDLDLGFDWVLSKSLNEGKVQ